MGKHRQPMHTVDQLREQMSVLRDSMRQDVDEFRERVIQETDYRRQVRRYPLAFCAGALLAGYLVVPKKQARTAGGQGDAAISGEANGPQRASARHEKTPHWAGVLAESLAQSAAVAVAEHVAIRAAQRTAGATQLTKEAPETAERAQFESADSRDTPREQTDHPTEAPAQPKLPVDQLSHLALVTVRRAIKRQPGISLLAAACAGVCAGWLMKRK